MGTRPPNLYKCVDGVPRVVSGFRGGTLTRVVKHTFYNQNDIRTVAMPQILPLFPSGSFPAYHVLTGRGSLTFLETAIVSFIVLTLCVLAAGVIIVLFSLLLILQTLSWVVRKLALWTKQFIFDWLVDQL